MAKALKILSVGSLGKRKKIGIFRKEQGESLKNISIDVDYFNISEGGALNYQRSFYSLKKKLQKVNYDIIHSHYGLSGMLSVLQRKIPVVVTFHGSDIWQHKVRLVSQITSYLSSWNIFISRRLKTHAKGFRRKRSSIIPCGIDLNVFCPMNKDQARNKMRLNLDEKYVLFSSAFNNNVKNYSLAKSVIQEIDKTKLIELKNFTRSEVNCLMNACDALLVTSFHESGPLVVKEALACNLPVISTDVGDVKEVIKGTNGSYLTSFNPKDIEVKLKLVLNQKRRTDGRKKIYKYELNHIAEKIFDVYKKILNIA